MLHVDYRNGLVHYKIKTGRRSCCYGISEFIRREKKYAWL